MGKKEPRAAFQPESGKNPRIGVDPGHYRTLRPTWRVARIDREGEWAWHAVTADALRDVIIPRLRGLESMTWEQIERDEHSHPMPAASICPDARKRLQALKLDDVDMLYQVNMGGKRRVWGIRENNILLLLWWDPEHTVYPTEKKHT